jgi:ribosomal-protein-alanine N-acetyltransferase
VTHADAPELAAVVQHNRAFMAPWEPVRDDAYFTEAGQDTVIGKALTAHERGHSIPHVIVDDDGRIVGRIALNGIVPWPFLSCSVGYWVAAADNGRGVATEAMAEIKQLAFHQLGLHRIQGETLLHNVASQRVLDRNGFVRIGMAPKFLQIAGTWQDHLLFHVLNEGETT